MEYTDIDNITDIADTDDDEKAINLSAVVRDIYNCELDISDIIENADKKSIKNAEVSGIEDRTYTGKAIEQEPVVKLGNEVLIEGQDYELSYMNNTNAGTAKVIITGMGRYTDSITAAFTINKASSTISIKSKKAYYNGNPVNYETSEAVIKGSSGKVTFAYYSDSDCTKKIRAANVKNSGIYYVKATVAADKNYNKATSKAVKLTIYRANNSFAIKNAKRSVTAGKVTLGVQVSDKGTGTKTYKIASVNKSAYARYFKIDSKNGRITVNKKTPKGKYVVTVKAKAALTRNYKASAVKTATVTITVNN